jgi:phenylacetate-CoA ligase
MQPMSDRYATFFRNVMLPAYERARGRRTFAYFDEYERSQWLDPEALEALRWQKLQRLLRHCWDEVPFYRKRWEAAGVADPADIRNLDDHARLPVLTKTDIRNNFDDLHARSLRDRMLYKATGGSTGEPLRLGYTRESYERRTAVMWRGYGWAGAEMGRRSLFLWGGPVGNPSRMTLLREKLYHRLFARRMLDCFAMTEANLHDYADAIDAYKPDIIVAYTGPLVRLAEWIVAEKRTVHRPVALVTGAEALHGFQREVIERAFGAPVFNTYGCREFMLIASECEQRTGLHINIDHLHVELLGGGPDAPGEVAVTDLSNDGMPFIRYLNGDLATPMSGACACGRGLPRLKAIDGRKLDAIRTPDGRIVPGEFFPHMLKDVRGLLQYQVVQRTLDSLDITLVRLPDFDESGLDYIRRETARVLGNDIGVRLHFADSIASTQSGKFRVTVSELA